MGCLVAIKRDGPRQSALALERPPEKGFGCRDIPLGAEHKIDRLSLFVDRTIEVSPAAFDLYVGFIDPPGGASSACEAVPPLFEFRDIARNPAHDRRMGQGNSALRHHFHEISKAELEPQIPADAEDDDFPVKMAALEKISNAQHSGSLPQKASFGEYAWLLPFAPEPRPKSGRLAPRVLALVEKGRSYRLIGREVRPSKNTVAEIVKRARSAPPHST